MSPQTFLMPEEINERKAKGLCYFCDEKYTPGHFKVHKKAQLFLLGMEEDRESELGDGDGDMKNIPPECDIAQILVNAISGISYYTTMRGKGIHKKHSLFILVDSRSTHNFLDIQVAEKLGRRLLPSGNARVKVAGGNRLNVKGKVDKLQWDFQETSFVADFMVIPLIGCDVVLGVQWLETLGPITWDFKKLTMKFDWAQRRVVLNGIHQGYVREIKAGKLNNNREETMQLSMLCVTHYCDEGVASLFAMETENSRPITYPPIAALLS